MKGHYSDVWQAVAAALPDRPAITTRDATITYRDFVRDAGAFATRLRAGGVRRGDALAILMYNRPEYLVALFACLATGIAPVPINYRYRSGEVADLLRDSHAAALLFPSSLSEVAAGAVDEARTDPLLIQVDDGGARMGGAIDYADVMRGAGDLPRTAPPDGELRLYTGGTTGRPRAVVWGTQDILEVQLYSIYAATGMAIPETMEDVVRIAEDPRTPRVATLPLAPFMHGTALFSSMNTLVLGGTVIIHASPRLDADEAVSLLADTGATRVIVAGDAVALPLAEAAERAGMERLGRVDSIVSSGMRFSDAAKTRLHRLGDIAIIDLLASTEGGPFAVSITHSTDDIPGRLRLLPGAVVFDESMREVQDTVGARGVLAFRGTLPRGYFEDEEKSRATFPEIAGVRHVMPGDWVQVQGDGCVELLGRGSSVVNTGGEKVYPVEVEEALLSHPDVADAVVFGLPDTRFGEMLTAVVVPAAGTSVSEAALRAHVDPLLAGYKKPRRILVRESLGRSPHGKIDMNQLIRDAARELSTP